MKRLVSLFLVIITLVLILCSCQIGDTRYILVCANSIVGPYVTLLELPTKDAGGETTLEFWIGEYVTESDYQAYDKVFQGFLGEGYKAIEGGNEPASEYYVRYRVDNYPHIYSPRKGILEIEITDPEVMVYGLTTESSLDEFADAFEALGADVTKSDSVVRAKIGDVWFRLYIPRRNGVPMISVSTQAPGAVMID